MVEKKLFRIYVVKTNEILGLDDFVYDKKYIFTVTCVSENAEYFTIDYNVK